MSDQASALHIEFFMEAIESPAKTRLEGRPIFEDKEFVRVKFPGDNKRVHVAPAHEGYRRDPETNEWVSYAQDYPRHYERFKQGLSQATEGTPISELPFLMESKRAELRALNIHTAEQLASLDGSFLTRLGMGGRALKDQAAAYIARASGGALEARLAAENADLKDQMGLLQAQMRELMETVAAPQSGPMIERHEDDAPATSIFAEWATDDLKAFIKDRTGAAPRGNPGHDTLVRMASEIVEAETAAEVA